MIIFSSKGILALIQLTRLHDEWVGDWKHKKGCIVYSITNNPLNYIEVLCCHNFHLLEFPKEDMANEFLNCFGPEYYLFGNGPYNKPEIYEKINDIPNFIFDKLFVLNGESIYIPANLSLIGKPLPKYCEEDLDKNNEYFEICYSPYRPTFCVLIITCDSNHIIQKVYYNAYATDSYYNKTNELRDVIDIYNILKDDNLKED